MASGDFERSLHRPKNYFKLSPQEQWDIDKRLGILDWEGECAHSNPLCKVCKARFVKHFGLKLKAKKK